MKATKENLLFSAWLHSVGQYGPRIPKFYKQYHAQSNCTETIRPAGNKKRIGTFIWA